MKNVELYGRVEPPCQFCTEAMATLTKRNIPFTFIDVNHSKDAREHMDRLGLRKIPQIFVDGEHVGDSTSASTLSLSRKAIKRDGSVVPFDASRINSMAEWAVKADSKANWSTIVMNAMHKLPEGDIKTSDIQDALISSCLDMESPCYNKVAGRLLLGDIRKSSIASMDFVEFYNTMVDDGYWRDMGYSDSDLAHLRLFIDHDKDLDYGYPTLRQFKDKSSMKDGDGLLLELPQYMYMGIAMSLFCDGDIEDVIAYYEKTSELKINIPSPIASTQRSTSNAGVSCVITTAGDSVQGIESSKHIVAVATAHSAGLGLEMDVRSPNDVVRMGYAKAGGKLPHYKVMDKLVKEFTQVNRGGSATVSFNVLDPEIEVLLGLKLPRTVDERRIELLDYSLVLNNEFLRRAAKKQNWLVVSKMVNPELHDAFYNNRDSFPSLLDSAIASGNGIIIPAMDILTQFLSARQETGRMYSFNVDNVNDHTPFKETVRLSNLCLEISLPTRAYNHITELYKPYSEDTGLTAQCFLSALDVARIEDDEDYYECAYIALKALDNLLDVMTYPFPQFKDSAQQYRSVGIGMTNMAYCISKNKKSYKDLDFIHDLSERHYYYLALASNKLAQERGKFDLYEDTKWNNEWLPIDTYHKNVDKLHSGELKYNWDELRLLNNLYGVRFSTLTCHMPCESSSVVANATNGLYPIRSEVIYKDSRSGTIQFFAPEVDVYDYELAWDIPTKDLYNMYAIVQKFNDQSISADTYLDYSKYSSGKVPMSVMIKDFLYASQVGLKTLYYLNSRTGRGEDNTVEPEVDCEGCSM